jgi:hypothetical protein
MRDQISPRGAAQPARLSICACLLLGLLLAACGGQSAANSTPLPGPTNTAEATATPVPSATPTPVSEAALADLPSKPDPSLDPNDVVRIQLKSFQNNDIPEPDSGIRRAFEFASPENREFTGPVDAFIELLHDPRYRDLLNFQRVEYGPVDSFEDTAVQPVMIVNEEGEPVVYMFALSRQTEPPYEDCWMTDGVMRMTPLSEQAQEEEEV